MNILVKRGSLDNVVTYEHYCDAKADLANIPKNQITLGSTAVVLQDEDGGMGIYIAGSDKEWVVVSTSSGSGAGGTTTLELIHVCSNNEYNSSTGLPTIQEPEENTIYFVPNEDEETNNLFNEYIYVNNGWEKIGNVETNFTVPIPDWDVDTYGQSGYIDNKPAIKKGTATWSIAEGHGTVASSIAAHAEGSSSVASGTNSHAEGVDTVASGSSAHAEGSNTIAASNYQHVFGEYNVADSNATYVEIVGNGDNNARSNARTLDWNGNEWLAGNLILNQTTLTESKLQYLNNLNIDNTLDINKPVSTAQRQAIDAVSTKTVEVTGTDVTISAVSNTRYICATLSTLSFTPSATGLCDVMFTSGSSKTILTLPNTVKMPDGFEVEANTVYEINILDGVYGVVASWPI